MSKAALMIELAEMEQKLDDTVSGLERGPVKDSMRLIVPMMKDQIKVLRAIVETMGGSGS